MARYGALDGLRGIAAAIVVAYHVGTITQAPRLFPHGYLAVDFFFVLSGFVLAAAYSGRAVPLSAFTRARLVRLMPMALFGLALGTAVRPDLTSILNAAMLPALWGGLTFPSNSALWSLSLELAVNIAWAAWLIRARTLALASVAALAFAGLAFAAHAHGSVDMGWRPSTLPGGTARAVFGFLAGVIAWRFKPPRALFPWWVSAVSLVALLAVPVKAWTVDVASVAIFPALVWSAGTLQAPVFRLLGEASYPLYAIHLPVLAALAMAGLTGFPAFGAVPVLIAAALGCARLYDRPVSAWIAQRIIKPCR